MFPLYVWYNANFKFIDNSKFQIKFEKIKLFNNEKEAN